jgi:hypothetical protein
MNRDEGGSAYPHKTWSDAYNEHAGSSGMSLRDYFAGQALMGMEQPAEGDDRWPDDRNAAVNAYRFADAMLKARKEP